MPVQNKKRKPNLNLIDGWSVPHFLFGMVAAMLALAFSLPLLPSFSGMILAALVWEFAEIRAGIRETHWNIMSDLVMPSLAFFLTTGLVQGGTDDIDHYGALFVVSLLLFIYFNVIAWQARYHKDESFIN